MSFLANHWAFGFYLSNGARIFFGLAACTPSADTHPMNLDRDARAERRRYDRIRSPPERKAARVPIPMLAQLPRQRLCIIQQGNKVRVIRTASKDPRSGLSSNAFQLRRVDVHESLTVPATPSNTTTPSNSSSFVTVLVVLPVSMDVRFGERSP